MHKVNESLAAWTTFRIGGKARDFWVISSESELEEAWQAASGRRPVILGGGSNVLLPDEDLDLVWKMGRCASAWERVDEYAVRVWAGNQTAATAWSLVRAGLGGWAEMTTLPGTIGGAVVGNAHAGGMLIGERVVRVETVKVSDGQKHVWLGQDGAWGYDRSRFQEIPEAVITWVDLRVDPGQDPAVMTQVARELMARKRQTQDPSEPSAGCFWQNVPNDSRLRALWPEMATRSLIPSGWIVEQSGVEIPSTAIVTLGKHRAYLVNRGGATAGQVRQVAAQIRQWVGEKFDVWLETEVVVLDQNGRRLSAAEL